MKTLNYIITLLVTVLASINSIEKPSSYYNRISNNRNDSIYIEYYNSGFSKNSREVLADGVTRIIEWYPNGNIKSRKLFWNAVHEPFFIEEWYENGIKRKEEYRIGYFCNDDRSFHGYMDSDSFCLHVFSQFEISTSTFPIPNQNDKDTTIQILSLSEMPIKSWYTSGMIETICRKTEKKGVLVEMYSEEGSIIRRGIFVDGQLDGDWELLE